VIAKKPVLAGHKYAIGQAVVYSPGSAQMSDAATNGKVTRLLPKEGAGYQYHVQFGPNGQQRRVEEAQLRSVNDPASRWMPA
jgi:hypothetical protein